MNYMDIYRQGPLQSVSTNWTILGSENTDAIALTDILRFPLSGPSSTFTSRQQVQWEHTDTTDTIDLQTY